VNLHRDLSSAFCILSRRSHGHLTCLTDVFLTIGPETLDAAVLVDQTRPRHRGVSCTWTPSRSVQGLIPPYCFSMHRSWLTTSTH